MWVFIAFWLLQEIFLAEGVFVEDDILTNNGVMFSQNAGILSNGPHEAASKFVEEVVVGGVQLGLAGVVFIWTFKGKLQFTLDFIHEKEVEENVVLFMVNPVLDAYNLEHFRSLLAYLDQILINSEEFSFRTAKTCTHQISHFETHQINLAQHFVVNSQLIFRQLMLVPLQVNF